jgi:hypothetical protein
MLHSDAQRMIECRSMREVDDHFGIGQRLVAIDIEDAHHFVAELPGHALDRAPHLAVAVDGDLHAGTALSNSA